MEEVLYKLEDDQLKRFSKAQKSDEFDLKSIYIEGIYHFHATLDTLQTKLYTLLRYPKTF